jgi:uncharacterized membrane protein
MAASKRKGGRGLVAFLRATFVGGIVFLMPVFLIAWILNTGFKLAMKLTQPALKLLPDSLSHELAVGTTLTILVIVGMAFAAGVFSRTATGQRLFQWIENSIVGSLPQFSFVRSFADSIDGEEHDNVEVVLVPADAGLVLGFVFRPEPGPIVPVFLPGAPQWTSGSVVFAKREDVIPAGIDFAEAAKILKRLGVGSAAVMQVMAAGSRG